MLPLHRDLKLEHTYDVIEIEGNIAPALEWCSKTFGPPGQRWFTSNHKIYFFQEKDAMLFELKF